MNKQTKKALEKSIEKYERDVEKLKAVVGKKYKCYQFDFCELTGITLGARSCPLCGLFITNSCCACPIFNKTNIGGCRGTPYYDIKLVILRSSVISNELISCFQAELDFLKSLREPS